MRTPTDLTPLADAARGIKLVVSDMDGTFLRPDKSYPDRFEALLERLHAAGIVFVPGSGRQYQTLEDMFRPWLEDLPIIAENGANVGMNGEPIARVFLPDDLVDVAIDRLREANVPGERVGIVYSAADAAYAEMSGPEFQRESLMYYHANATVPDLKALDKHAFKIAAYDFGDPSTHTLPLFEDFEGRALVVRSGEHWMDINPLGVSKGSAVAALQKRFGASPAETVVFGDYHNDLPMFEHSDLSFAMANAHEDVVEAARYVAPSNAEDGVITTLNTLMDLAGR